MPNILSFSVHYQPKAYTNVIFRHYYRNLWIKILSAGGLISLALCTTYLLGFNPLRFSTFPLFALLYGLLTLLVPVLLYLKTQKAFNQSWIFRQKINVQMNDSGINLSTEEFQRLITWEEIIKAESYENDWLIYLSKSNFFYLPCNQIEKANQETVTAWLKEKVNT